ncbi:ankyrin repeat domain-containing protein [Wolbachia endosymbiont of Tetranychus urticae]|uniref:ankyrin repeat domain-containing protein n=1 Tax=Wolbachia endosymbiont of Tetranychus urticae TaxID=169184 RepID=UPI0039785BA4
MLDNQSPEASTANTSQMNENQFYFAIRSSNLKLIKTLVAQCKSSNKLDESLSQAYDELRLKNVPISDEIRIFVESTLIDLRFFSNTSTKQAQINKNSIRERIQLVLENINLLKTEYSNIKAVDEKFLFIAKFVVQNIHILKRQLKSTYDRLPWEEVEFCLVSFISSYMKRQEINLFYQASLNKFKILNYLETFGARLEEEIEGVNIDKLSDLPKLKREEVISEIISSSPEFEELYSDYQQIRDIHSLKKISNYINLALSADPKQKEGQLVITRTLQVIGECLKNTLDSPKLSSTTSGLLLLSLPQNTRKILIDLRNSLSHAYSLSKRMDIEENADINFFVGIQNNIRKIGDVVTGILFNSKMKTVRMLLKKIINSKNLDEIKEVAAVLDNVKLEIGSLVSSKMTEDEKLEKLVKELSDIITDKTNDEQELFDKINNIISSIKAKSKNIKTDYVMGFALLESLSSQFNDNKVDKNVIRGIKFRANKILENISPKIDSESLKEIAILSTRVSHTVRSRMTGKGLDEVNRLIYEIFCIAEFGVDDNKSIRKLREKLKGNTTFEDKKSKGYDISEKKHNKQLELKLFQLKEILNDNKLVDNFTEKFSSYDSDKKLQAAIEMLVLDIMSILERENRLVNNLLFLDDNTPLLTGKYLRDHLAHDNLLVTTLLPDPSIAVFLNARKLTVEGMLQNKKKIGKLLKNDPDKVKEKYNQDFTTIDNQQKMFIALEEGDLETFKYCLEKGADIGARDINLWTTLHFAIKGSNLETIKYILDHSVNASAKDIDGQSPLHIAAAKLFVTS